MFNVAQPTPAASDDSFLCHDFEEKKTSIMHKYYLCKSDCPYRCCDVVQKQQLYINLLHYSSIVTTAMIDRQSVDLLDILYTTIELSYQTILLKVPSHS